MPKRPGSPLSKDEPTKKSKVTGYTAEGSQSPPPSPFSDAPDSPPPAGRRKEMATKFATKSAGDKRPKKPTTKKATGVKKATGAGKAAPVKDQFEPWTPPQPTIAAVNDFWGIRPVMRRVDADDEDSAMLPHPLPHPDQPSARESNGATNPPMWEDLGAHFKPGRMQKYTSATAPEDADSLPANIDQGTHLQIKLIDMRCKGKSTEPARQPVTYHYGEDEKDAEGVQGKLGKRPVDWTNKQALKCLNDRRQQVINRLTKPNDWTAVEREFLAQLFEEFPDASIWEIAARWNTRFIGDAIDTNKGPGVQYICQGRTVEDVRNEYVTYKPAYDGGKAPTGARPKKNYSDEGVAATKEWEARAEKYGCHVKGKWSRAAAVEDDKVDDEMEPVEQDLDDELLELAGHAQWFKGHPNGTPPSPSAGNSPSGEQHGRTGLDPNVDNATVATTVSQGTQTAAVTETEAVIVNANGTISRATQTDMEDLATLPKRRNASEIFHARMRCVDENYDDDDDEML